jgi:hypothetical protein
MTETKVYTLHRGTLEALRERLVEEVAEGDWLVFQAKCVRAFGPTAGIFVRQLVFWTGKSTLCADGWLYKNRDEWQAETGLGHYEQDKARKILTGQRPWAGETREVIEEHRQSRRQSMRYRVDLWALASVLGCGLPDPRTSVDEIDDFDLEDETPLQDETGQKSESPRGGQLSRHGGANSVATHVAAESPRASQLQRVPTESTFRKKPSESSSLQDGENGFSSRPSPPLKSINNAHDLKTERTEEPPGPTPLSHAERQSVLNLLRDGDGAPGRMLRAFARESTIDAGDGTRTVRADDVSRLVAEHLPDAAREEREYRGIVGEYVSAFEEQLVGEASA